MEEKGEENGCHKELLLDNMRGRRALGHEGNLKVTDDLINNFMKKGYSYLLPACFLDTPKGAHGEAPLHCRYSI